MTAYASEPTRDDTESILKDTFAPQPERPYPLHAQLSRADIMNLMGITKWDLWEYIEAQGVRLNGHNHKTAAYGDLVAKGIVE